MGSASQRTLGSGSYVVRLANRWTGSAWAMRLAVSLSLWIGLATAAAMAVLARDESGGAIGLLVVRAVGWMSWINGALVAWAVVGELRREQAGSTIAALIWMRGYGAKTLRLSRLVSAAVRITLLTGGPGLLLCIFAAALSVSVAAAPWLVLLALGLLAYASVLGVAVALLVYWSMALAPRHARLLLAAVVLGPCLANYVFSAVPTLPGLFAWLLSGLSTIGVMA